MVPEICVHFTSLISQNLQYIFFSRFNFSVVKMYLIILLEFDTSFSGIHKVL